MTVKDIFKNHVQSQHQNTSKSKTDSAGLLIVQSQC